MGNIIMNASNILVSELKSSRRYMTVSMRMFSTRANLNHVAVTEAFIDDIIANKNEYICMPLCADVPKLRKKDYRGLTHLYDKATGTFLADRIGGFYDFEKVSDEYGVSLIGHARVDKRCEEVCAAIEELYANNALNFSFEITAGDLRVENGVTIVDASENNELTAMAIVSVPAYPESKALDLVAEAETNDALNEYYSNTKFIAAEIDLEIVRRKFFDALRMYTGKDEIWHMRPLLFCHDCVILYDEICGTSFKAVYAVINDEVTISDFYQIAFERVGGSENEMNEENVSTIDVVAPAVEIEAKLEAEVEVEAEVQASAESQEVEQMQAETESAAVLPDEKEPMEDTDDSDDLTENDSEDKDEPDDADDKNEMAEAVESVQENDALAEMTKRCAELEAQVEELMSFKAELDKIKAEREEAEINAKKEQLREYAIAEGLDIESEVVASAIEEMNHEALVAEVMAKKNAEKKNGAEITYVASCDIKVSGDYGYLLGHSNN